MLLRFAKHFTPRNLLKSTSNVQMVAPNCFALAKMMLSACGNLCARRKTLLRHRHRRICIPDVCLDAPVPARVFPNVHVLAAFGNTFAVRQHVGASIKHVLGISVKGRGLFATSPATCASVNCLFCCEMIARAASRLNAGESLRTSARGSPPQPIARRAASDSDRRRLNGIMQASCVAIRV